MHLTTSIPAGVLFLAMAFFIFLPMIILAPAKFAMTFSIGSGEQGRLLGLACHFCERLAAVLRKATRPNPLHRLG